jgi:hypothetical protein
MPSVPVCTVSRSVRVQVSSEHSCPELLNTSWKLEILNEIKCAFLHGSNDLPFSNLSVCLSVCPNYLFWITFSKLGDVAAVYQNSSVFWVTTQRSFVKQRRFGTTYRSHLQGSRALFFDNWPFKIGPTGSSETSVLNQPTLRNNP